MTNEEREIERVKMIVLAKMDFIKTYQNDEKLVSEAVEVINDLLEGLKKNLKDGIPCFDEM